MVLCDAAQEAAGKLYIIGGGWNVLLQPNVPTSIALAIILHFDWNETNRKHQIEIELQTADGEVFEVEENPVRVVTSAEVGRPPGIKPGSEINAPLAPSFNGLALPSGSFVWILRVGEAVLARAPFIVLEGKGV